jgi:hypothetical protein
MLSVIQAYYWRQTLLQLINGYWAASINMYESVRPDLSGHETPSLLETG